MSSFSKDLLRKSISSRFSGPGSALGTARQASHALRREAASNPSSSLCLRRSLASSASHSSSSSSSSISSGSHSSSLSFSSCTSSPSFSPMTAAAFASSVPRSPIVSPSHQKKGHRPFSSFSSLLASAPDPSSYAEEHGSTHADSFSLSSLGSTLESLPSTPASTLAGTGSITLSLHDMEMSTFSHSSPLQHVSFPNLQASPSSLSSPSLHSLPPTSPQNRSILSSPLSSSPSLSSSSSAQKSSRSMLATSASNLKNISNNNSNNNNSAMASGKPKSARDPSSAVTAAALAELKRAVESEEGEAPNPQPGAPSSARMLSSLGSSVLNRQVPVMKKDSEPFTVADDAKILVGIWKYGKEWKLIAMLVRDRSLESVSARGNMLFGIFQKDMEIPHAFWPEEIKALELLHEFEPLRQTMIQSFFPWRSLSRIKSTVLSLKKKYSPVKWALSEKRTIFSTLESHFGRKFVDSALSHEISDDIWAEVTQTLTSRTMEQCKAIWDNQMRPNLELGEWTPKEDQVLSAILAKGVQDAAEIHRRYFRHRPILFVQMRILLIERIREFKLREAELAQCQSYDASEHTIEAATQRLRNLDAVILRRLYGDNKPLGKASTSAHLKYGNDK